MNNDFLFNVDKYYSNKLSEHGIVPNGVDWKDKESQYLRFEKIYDLFRNENHVQLNDLGCGYGEFVTFLDNRKSKYKYIGYDISERMVIAARERYRKNKNASFVKYSNENLCNSEFTIASGVFNVKLSCPDAVWINYVLETIQEIIDHSKKGIAINMMSKYSDLHLAKDYLYYANPSFVFDFCKTMLSKKVTLLHDYDLYEFTILVKK